MVEELVVSKQLDEEMTSVSFVSLAVKPTIKKIAPWNC